MKCRKTGGETEYRIYTLEANVKKSTFLNAVKEHAIPLAVIGLILVAAVFNLSSGLDARLYDAFLRFRPSPKESPAIRLIDFDDRSIAKAGEWPVSRATIGDGLILMREMGAKYAIFDIDYMDPSPRGVDQAYLGDALPANFKEGFGSINGDMEALFGAITSGQIPAREAKGYVADLVARSNRVETDLLGRVQRVARDNDEYLGEAAGFFGHAFFTLNMRPVKVGTTSPDYQTRALAKAGKKIDTAPGTKFSVAQDFIPAIEPILMKGAGAGFPNVPVDPDGVRRRIDLFWDYKGSYVAQLTLAPLLDILGNPNIKADNRTVVLEGATLPDGTKATIRIPRASDGRLLINWPHKTFIESFHHVSFSELIEHRDLYLSLTHNLRIREDWGYLDLYPGPVPLMELSKRSDVALEEALGTAASGGPVGDEAVARYRAARDEYLAAVGTFLDAKPEDAIMGQVKALIADPRLPPEGRVDYERILADAPAFFEKTRSVYESLMRVRSHLGENLEGAICIIGNTATSTTDIGVNPFAGEYMNVGTHASVLNSFLQRDFIDDLPPWASALIGVACCVLLAFLLAGKKPVTSILIGLGWTLALVLGIGFIFRFTGYYIPATIPLVSSVLVFLSITIASFFKAEKDKGFLRSAFSHYLSNEVINVIIANPDKLSLGGEKRRMTALFTDIRGFSTISEKLAPEELVQLLNRYLTAMSDTILDLKGTIDKYEGDAIIAFFNAPIDIDDHAYRACLAAVRMKLLEEKLSEELVAEGKLRTRLFTRVGINTGDMVVGNMGTNRKMDYTIIGDAVNLASRLEGVNKEYGTAICVADEVLKEAGDKLLTRRLDRIRVVGKKEPVTIHEVMAELHGAGDGMKRLAEGFTKARDAYESRDWRLAAKLFTELSLAHPDDGPSQVFLARAEAYAASGEPAGWDGVYDMTHK
jgi:adenylate cyclase